MKKYFFVILLFALAAFSCSKDVPPDEQVRQYIGDIENHFEQRQATALKKYIAEEYRDGYGNTRKELLRFAAGYILHRPVIHVQTKIDEILIHESEATAEVKVNVAITSEPLAEGDIRQLQGEFHRFHITLHKNNNWQLHSLQWQNISIDEYLEP